MHLLITNTWRDAHAHLAELEAMGHSVRFLAQESDPLPFAPEWVEGVIESRFFKTHPIGDFPNLRYIQLTSVGLDRNPVEEIRARGIRLCNADGVYAVPMAEYTVMRMLELCRKASETMEHQRERAWVKGIGQTELSGKTVCILGFGNYGRETAKRLKAFGVTVLAVNRTQKESPYVDAWYPLARMEEAFARADVVMLAVALTPETRGIIGRAQFGAMKRGALFVNAARGALTDEAALLDALRSGRLSAAAVDAFCEEPLPADSPLRDAENLLLSSHNSYISDGNAERMWRVIRNNLEREG